MRLTALLEETVTPADSTMISRINSNVDKMIRIKGKKLDDNNPDNDDDVLKTKTTIAGTVSMTTLNKILKGTWASPAEVELIVSNFLATYNLNIRKN